MSTEQDSVRRPAEIGERAPLRWETVLNLYKGDAVTAGRALVFWMNDLSESRKAAIDSLTAERDQWHGLAERAEPIIRDLKDANMRLLARAEAAEAERDMWKRDADEWSARAIDVAERLSAAEAEVKRLREALEWYADRQIYFHDSEACGLACSDEGDRARTALATPPSEGGKA